MTERILEEFEHKIQDLVLIPSRGGVFEVVVDDKLVYSKKQTGRHAEHDEILEQIRALGLI
ncbi:MAG: SelT/SelW/SelH family protein [Actinobacteria bacterium]|nr:SelT/SelW/SelH family protein [Actinomycetota bacterium]